MSEAKWCQHPAASPSSNPESRCRMINLETFRAHLESARHSIGHAMTHAAQGYTIAPEQELVQATAALDAARRMLDDKEGSDA